MMATEAIPRRVSFVEAVNYGITRTFDWSTPATRSEFWYFYLFCVLSSLAAILMDGTTNMLVQGMGSATLTINLILFLPMLSCSIRRIKDVGLSRKLVLVTMIPAVGFLILIYLCTKPSMTISETPESPS